MSRFVICVDVCCLQQEKSKQLRDWKDKTFFSSSSLQKWDALVFRRHACFSGASQGWGLLRSSAWDKGLSWVSSNHEMNQGSAPFRAAAPWPKWNGAFVSVIAKTSTEEDPCEHRAAEAILFRCYQGHFQLGGQKSLKHVIIHVFRPTFITQKHFWSPKSETAAVGFTSWFPRFSTQGKIKNLKPSWIKNSG